MVYVCPLCGAVLRPVAERSTNVGIMYCYVCQKYIPRERALNVRPCYFRDFDPKKVLRSLHEGLNREYKPSTLRNVLMPTLKSLGIIDRNGELTGFGKKLVELGLCAESLTLLKEAIEALILQCEHCIECHEKTVLEAKIALNSVQQLLHTLGSDKAESNRALSGSKSIKA